MSLLMSTRLVLDGSHECWPVLLGCRPHFHRVYNMCHCTVSVSVHSLENIVRTYWNRELRHMGTLAYMEPWREQASSFTLSTVAVADAAEVVMTTLVGISSCCSASGCRSCRTCAAAQSFLETIFDLLHIRVCDASPCDRICVRPMCSAVSSCLLLSSSSILSAAW